MLIELKMAGETALAYDAPVSATLDVLRGVDGSLSALGALAVAEIRFDGEPTASLFNRAWLDARRAVTREGEEALRDG